MEKTPSDTTKYLTLFQPENKLENQVLEDPDFLKGLEWGVPRFGHPEGEVYKHICEVLDNVARLETTPQQRQILRLTALVHDTFKFMENKTFPRDWSKHHGVYARRFMEKYTDNQILLDLLELHDEAYYSWRFIHLYNRLEEGQQRLRKLLERVGEHRQIYYLFFKCDTQTGDKNQAPLKWFEKVVPGIKVVPSLW